MILSNTTYGQKRLKTVLNTHVCVNVSALIDRLIATDPEVSYFNMRDCSELDSYSTLVELLDKEVLLSYIDNKFGLDYSKSKEVFIDEEEREISVSRVIDENDIELSEFFVKVCEYYTVGDTLKRALIDAGATVICVYGQSIWCRTCTGQVVWMDSKMKNALTSLM